jgi:hypothetical protein
MGDASFVPYISYKLKVKLSLCLAKYHAMEMNPVLNHHAMKTYEGAEV